MSSPGQMLSRAANAIVSNVLVYASIVFFCALMYVVNVNASSFLAGYASTYNSGLGQIIDIYLQILNLPSILFRGFVPIYNLAVQMILQLVYFVFIPFTRVNEDVIPEFIENLMSMCTALVVSTRSFVSHVYSCVVPSTAIEGGSVAFLPMETQCYANVNYFEFDAMTPSIYTRKMSLNLQNMLVKSCGPMGVLVELVMFPLVDFNLYRVIHGAVNAILHTLVALPVMTVRRCEHGTSDDRFTKVEKTIMCIPDFTPLHALIIEMHLALGVLIDNWLNVALILVERAITGDVSVSCDSAYEQRFNMTRAGDLFAVSSASLKIVGMTDRLFAVTDGLSTEYHTTTVTDHTEMAIGNWPFQINVGYGVAAVQQGEVADMDGGGDSRTGLLGCQCLDKLDADGVPGIEILCASVPYTVHQDNETDYNTTSIHRVNFDAAITGTYLTCDTTKIKVSTLRFSQKRFSRELESSMEVDYLSEFNTFGMSGVQQPFTYFADAAIYVQPLCYDGTTQRCQLSAQNCFPWCMGLHIAGQTGQNISMYNARHWDENVNLKQVDCAVTSATEVCERDSIQGYVINEEFGVRGAAVCNQGCTFDYNSETFMRLEALSADEKNETFLRTKTLLTPTLRIGQQPLVVAGDIMLVRDEETRELMISRLFDVSRGLFTRRSRHLALVRNEETVPMITECETEDDDMCFSEAAKNNQIVDPPSYKLAAYNETPTAVSEFGIHWAVNPAASALKVKYEDCAVTAPTGGSDFVSSFGKARVWTLRPVRASSATSGGQGGLVSYMVVPNFMSVDTRCREVVNQRVVDLEYINSENILVTVYRAAPRDYNWRTGYVYEGRFFEYSMYYLHPNRKDCTEGQDLGNHFSCWKSVSTGMFSAPDFAEDKIGTLCPSMRRMPEFGSAMASMSIAGFGFLKIVVDVVTIVPAAASDIASIFRQPRERFTFHTVLDTSGETLFEVETIVSHIDRSTMILAHTIPRLFGMLEGRKGYIELQPRFIGTAKVTQHMGFIDFGVGYGYRKVSTFASEQIRKVTTPIAEGAGDMYKKMPFKKEMSEMGKTVLTNLDEKLARPFFNVYTEIMNKLPTDKVMETSSALMGRYMSMGGLMPTSPPNIRVVMAMRRAMNMATSQITMNTRLARIFFMKVLLGDQGQADSISNLLTSVLYEMEYDIDRSYFESMRVQCDGLGQILGRNSWGNSLKHTCLMIPAGMRSTLRAFMVFSVEYRVMNCICKLADEVNSVQFVKSECLPRNSPMYMKSFTLDFLQSDVSTQQDLCFGYMDAANRGLLTAFDPLFNHMYKAGENYGSVLDSILNFGGVNSGNCADFHASPYVITLLPEPSDYFMSCMDTFDCRARCLDTYEAFEQALNSFSTTPSFEISHKAMVQSRFFSIEDAENGVDRPPFALHGMAELSGAACELVCSESNIDNRCIAVAGLLESNRIGLGYYCMPHNFMDSVYEFKGLAGQLSSQSNYYKDNWGDSDAVSNIYLLTVDSILEGRPEMLLVSTQKQSDPNLQSLWVFTSSGDKFLLAETEIFQADVTNDYSLHTISSVRVVPGKRSEKLSEAQVFVKAARFISDNGDSDTMRLIRVCVKYKITINNFLGNLDIDGIDDEMAFSARVSRESAECSQDSNFNHNYDDQRKIVCLDSSCHDQLRIPLGNFRTVNMVRYDSTTDTSTEYTSLNPQSNLASLLALDPSYALILTSGESYEINRKIISDLSPRSLGTCANGVDECINFIVVGRLSVAQAWLHNVYLTIKPDRTFSSRLLGGVDVEQTVKTTGVCSLQNCAACANSDSSAANIDLQNKCYAASQCGVRRCVGTIVNMKRPLCNLGRRMSRKFATLRIGTHGAWNAMASMIIVSVELTASRRDEYRISWPQEIFMASACNVKDFTVETVAMLTSVSGAVLASMHEEKVPGASYDANEAAIDVRVHGKEIMFVTALTNLLAAFAMAPIYFTVAMQKVIDCRADGFLIIVNRVISTSGSDVKILRGTTRMNEASDELVGVCMSKYGDIAATDTDNGQEKVAGMVGQILSDIRSLRISYYFEPYVHITDAVLSWMLGVTTGIMDVAQTIDWTHCKLPVTSLAPKGLCTCNDKAVVIPDIQRHARIATAGSTHALWCSGPIMLSNVDGSDLLIWNPYSLHELLHPKENGGSGDYDIFLECLRSAASNCEQYKPALPVITAQGAEVMQVVTRCRANYQQSTWDEGAIYLGMYDHAFWQNSPASFAGLRKISTNPAVVKRLIQISQYISTRGGEIADEATISCLETAWAQNVGVEACMKNYFLYSNHLEAMRTRGTQSYFAYQPYRYDATFVSTDACQTFSGDMKAVNSQSGLSYPLTVWSPSSKNRLDVAAYHDKLTGNETERFGLAEAHLNDLLENTIQDVLASTESTISDDFEIRAWSFEADEIHQLVDCVVLGPYASADLQSTFDIPGGQRLPVQQYHRGDPASRNFYPGIGYMTGGSDARKHIIRAAQDTVKETYVSGVKEQFTAILSRIKRVYGNVDNFLCTCPGGQNSSLTCCKDTYEEITFPAKDLFGDIWNFAEEMQEHRLDELLNNNLLQRDLWHNPDFSYQATTFTDAQKEELHDKYVFDYSNPVREYSRNEVMAQFTQDTLWLRCMDLLSMPFFTLPVTSNSEHMDVDADMTYDPTSDNSAFLHGMEEGVQRILERARKDSPVYWTHVHRYMPSDSVWCEDLNAIPTPATPVANVQYNENELAHGRFSDDIKKHTLTDTVFVGKVPAHCVCGWTVEDGGVTKCGVPACASVEVSGELNQSWHVLCERGHYDRRDDLFTLLQVIQETTVYDSSFKSCADVKPSLTWGLLDSKKHKEWYDDTDTTYSISLQELGSTGPSGLRLGLLGRGQDSQMEWVAKHNLLRRDPSHLPFNFAKKHTIAQPYCEPDSPGVWKDDLKKYFRDVFFPMAHTVHASAVASYCSTWVVEYALGVAFRHIYNSTDHPEVIEQDSRQAKWKQRCDIQLQQIGICNLRGVYDIVPSNPEEHYTPEKCSFGIGDPHGCEDKFYVTHNCLVMCDSEFYDPCACATDSDCGNFIFTKSACENKVMELDPRSFARDDDVLLYSMHWPASVHYNETAGVPKSELDTTLDAIRRELAETDFEKVSLYDRIKNLILDHDDAKNEGSPPNAYCDDLIDYYDDVQHPVGYHPTTACLNEDTHLRGFDSWMSMGATDASYTVDPVRLRNMTLYSTTFGAAHLVCDAAVYGTYGHELNPFYITTRWDENEAVDPAVPVTRPPKQIDEMLVRGSPSQVSTDTPIISDDRILVHSVGLIRDWLRWYGDDPDMQTTLDSEWPHLTDDEKEYFGLAQDEAVEGCPMPPLRTCTGDNECTHDTLDMKCLKPPVSELNEAGEGICAQSGTCYQHDHCGDGQMCSGEGVCVTPYIIFNNRDDQPVNVQLFADENEDCNETMLGVSQGQGVSSFAHDNGMCSLRNWYMYDAVTRSATVEGQLRLVEGDMLAHWPEDVLNKSVSQRDMLHTAAHDCDRSYQYLRSLCGPRNIKSVVINRDNTIGSVEPDKMVGIRTRLSSGGKDIFRFCDMPDSDQITGFLSPYVFGNETRPTEKIDTLRYVHQTVARCDEFNVCPALKFTVGGVTVQRKVISGAQFNDDLHRLYRNNDADQCYAAGYRTDVDCFGNKECECVVDRYTSPLLNGIFADGTVNVPTDTFVRPTDNTWGDETLQAKFQRVKTECEHAFTNTIDGRSNFDLFKHYFEVLTRKYASGDRVRVTRYANTLLLSLFGIDAESGSRRGMQDVNDYASKTRCVRYLSTALQAAENIVTDGNMLPPYRMESVDVQPVPGKSLYFFHERATIPVSFDWFWKCVVLAADETEGGAQREWFQIVTATSAQESLVCENVKGDVGGVEKLRNYLKTTDKIFELAAETDQTENSLIGDIDNVVSYALDQLQITMLPNVYCVKCSNDCSDNANKRKLYHRDTCWSKVGFTGTAKVAELEIEQPGTGVGKETIYSMYRYVYEKMLGSRNPEPETVSSLMQKDPPRISEVSLDDDVVTDANFIPTYVFVHLKEAVQTRPDYSDPDVTIDPDDTSCVDIMSGLTGTYLSSESDVCKHDYRELLKYEFEFVGGVTKLIDGTLETRKYLTLEQAKYEIFRIIEREIFSTFNLQTFVLRENGLGGEMMPVREESVDVLDIMNDVLETNGGWNVWMAEKDFTCSDGDEMETSETNQAHKRLRDCVQDLKEEIGWKVDRRVKLEVKKSLLTGSFYPSFSEPVSDTFLDELTSKSVSENAPAQYRMCYRDMRTGGYNLLNPLWSGNYDISSCPDGLSCGCDTRLEKDWSGGNTRVVDTRCGTPAEQCREQFPRFYQMLYEQTPEHCIDLGRSVTAVGMRREGSLPDNETPLCRKTRGDTECTGRFGSLHGHQGEPVVDVHARPSTVPVLQRGLFSTSNSIFRRQHTDRFTPNVVAMGVLNSDIGGHGLEFGVDSDGSMHLDCIHLGTGHTECGDSNNQFLPGAHNWLTGIENSWSWQHSSYENDWDPDMERSLSVSWKCPLQWWSAYSNASKSYSVRTPLVRRNRIRFQHITGRAYRNVHPVVQSLIHLPNLRPARFMSDNRACTDDTCRDKLSYALTDMYDMAAGGWKQVVLDGAASDEIIDWPASPFVLYDDKEEKFGSDVAGSVLDRLPAFAMKYEQRDEPVLPRPESASVAPAGVCRMRRLPRFDTSEEQWPANRHLQMCTRESGGVRCKYTEDATVGYITFNYTLDHLNPRSSPSRHKRCSACTQRPGQFQGRDLQRTTLASKMMSVGVPMTVKTERIVARYLRSRICPRASEDACEELEMVFNSSYWKTGQFLKEFLHADDTSDFYQTWIPDTTSAADVTPTSDDHLWARNWVFCDHSLMDGCSGSITKAEWIDPNMRAAKCKERIIASSSVDRPVEFCLIDENTERLCNAIVTWNQQIMRILCQAKGLPSCPDHGFFYTPASYSMENQEFASDTVADFYNALDSTACPATTDSSSDELIQAQIDSNNNLLQECASVSMQPVREILQSIRGAVTAAFKIYYFGMMLLLQIVQIALGSVIGPSGTSLVSAAVDRMLKYIGLLMESISNFFHLILEAVWTLLIEQTGSFGKFLQGLISLMCRILNFLRVDILCPMITKILVPIINIVGDAVKFFNKGAGNDIKRGAASLLVLADDHLCDYTDCDFKFLSEGEYHNGALPVPTRCWASYLTYYGDTDALSCSRADTCRSSLTNNSRIVCAQCASAMPGYLDFSCEPMTKLCTCNVQRYVRTACSTNDDCNQAGAACNYLLSDLSLSTGVTSCDTCQTQRICYLDVLTDERFCACGLFPLRFSTCSPEALGIGMMPSSDKLCLYQPDGRFLRMNTYSAQFSDMLSVPCMEVGDISSVICNHVIDQGQHMLVAKSVIVTGRRLLGMPEDGAIPSNITLNGVCRDALQSTHLPQTRLECQTAIQRSLNAVRSTGLSGIASDCTFCSIQDLWHEVAENPRFLLHVRANPGIAVQLLRWYGPGRRLTELIWRGLRWLEVTYHGMFVESPVVNRSVTNTSEIIFAMTGVPPPSSRRLLGIRDIADKVETKFNEIYDLHVQYASRLSANYDYSYGGEGDAGDHWRENWPPNFEYPSDSQCQPFFDVLELLVESVKTTELSYTRPDLQRTPARSIREGWPRIQNFTAVSSGGGGFEERLPSNVMEKWFVLMLREILYWFKVAPRQIQNIYLSVLDEMKRLATCDFHAIQTCSRFNVRLLHGIVIMTVYFSVWILFWNSVRLPVVLLATTPVFLLLLLYMCYGYSPVCGPMVPVCMVEDIQQTLRFFFPKFLVLPRSLFHEKPGCDVNDLTPNATCIKNCSSDPFRYDSWEDVFAWSLVEVGGPVANFTMNNLNVVPFIDHHSIRRVVNQKEQIIIHGDDDMLVAQRICALINSYLLAPYLLLAWLLVSVAVAIIGMIPVLLTPVVQVITQLYVAIFTK